MLLYWDGHRTPVLVKMNDLPKSQQPRSDDPDFWNVWTGKDEKGNAVERINWEDIANDWQQKTSSNANEEKRENEKNE